jgi:hypothetical protein
MMPDRRVRHRFLVHAIILILILLLLIIFFFIISNIILPICSAPKQRQRRRHHHLAMMLRIRIRIRIRIDHLAIVLRIRIDHLAMVLRTRIRIRIRISIRLRIRIRIRIRIDYLATVLRTRIDRGCTSRPRITDSVAHVTARACKGWAMPVPKTTKASPRHHHDWPARQTAYQLPMLSFKSSNIPREHWMCHRSTLSASLLGLVCALLGCQGQRMSEKRS